MGTKKIPTQKEIEEFLFKNIDIQEAATFIIISHADAGAFLASVGNLQINEEKRVSEVDPKVLVIAAAKGKKPFMVAVCYEQENQGNKKYRQAIADSVLRTNSSFCRTQPGSTVVKMTDTAIQINESVWPTARFKIGPVFTDENTGLEMMTFKKDTSQRQPVLIPVPPTILQGFLCEAG